MTHEQVGAISVLILIGFCVGVWCGTGLGKYLLNKNRVYLWLENGWIADVEADDAERVDLIVVETNTVPSHAGETAYVWKPNRLSHAGRAAREAAKH
jgi:hypothetical protein